MIIVLEGLSGVGKTTIANYIYEIYDIPMYRCFSLTNYLINEDVVNKGIEELVVSDFLEKIQLDGHIVLDRSLISSYVYNMVFKHDNTIVFCHDNLLEWMEELNNGVNGPLCIIHVTANDNISINRMKVKNGIFKKPGDDIEYHNALKKHYENIMNYLAYSNKYVKFRTICNDNTVRELYNITENIMDDLLINKDNR